MPDHGSSVADRPVDHSAPHTVMGTLMAIDQDLASRANDYEQAASDRARLTRDWDKRLAISHAQAKGPNADSRKASALLIAIDMDDLYERLKDAESRFEALRVVMRTLETRSAIGMSILKSQGRA